jgi:hypothetical protein
MLREQRREQARRHTLMCSACTVCPPVGRIKLLSIPFQMYTVFACLSHSLINANTMAFSGACKDTSTMPPRPEQASKKASEQQTSNVCHDQGREEEPTYIPAIWTITLCANVRYFGGAFAPLYCADADAIASKHSENSLGELRR